MAVPAPRVHANTSAGPGGAVSPLAGRHASVPAQPRIRAAVEKMLIYNAFAMCCYRIATEEVYRKETALSATVAPPVAIGEGHDTAAACVATGGAPSSPFLCHVLQLSAEGAEPPRFSTRSGRQLSECESLHEKHREEYHFLMQVMVESLRLVAASHEELAKQQQTYIATLMGRREMQNGHSAAAMKAASSGAHNGHENDDSIAVANTSHGSPHAFSLFDGFATAEVPHISLSEYVSRLVRFTYASPSVLIIACLYLDRLLLMHSALLLTECTTFKLLTVALRLSSKVYDTRTLSNKDFAHIAGVTVEELGALETDFLHALRFDLHVSAEEFAAYTRDLVAAGERGEVYSPHGTAPLSALPTMGRHSRRCFPRGMDIGYVTSLFSRSSGPVYTLVSAAGPAPLGTSTATVSYVSIPNDVRHTASILGDGNALNSFNNSGLLTRRSNGAETESRDDGYRNNFTEAAGGPPVTTRDGPRSRTAYGGAGAGGAPARGKPPKASMRHANNGGSRSRHNRAEHSKTETRGALVEAPRAEYADVRV